MVFFYLTTNLEYNLHEFYLPMVVTLEGKFVEIILKISGSL